MTTRKAREKRVQMSEENTQNQVGNTSEENGNEPAGGEGGKTFTQAEVDAIIKKRLARAEKPSDYDELKAKAAKLDELEEANKSELQKITEERDSLTKQLAEFKAAEEHRKAVDEAVETYKLSAADAKVLARMSGDVTENASMLADIAKARPKYPNVTDDGEEKPPSVAKEIPTII